MFTRDTGKAISELVGLVKEAMQDDNLLYDEEDELILVIGSAVNKYVQDDRITAGDAQLVYNEVYDAVSGDEASEGDDTGVDKITPRGKKEEVEAAREMRPWKQFEGSPRQTLTPEEEDVVSEMAPFRPERLRKRRVRDEEEIEEQEFPRAASRRVALDLDMKVSCPDKECGWEGIAKDTKRGLDWHGQYMLCPECQEEIKASSKKDRRVTGKYDGLKTKVAQSPKDGLWVVEWTTSVQTDPVMEYFNTKQGAQDFADKLKAREEESKAFEKDLKLTRASHNLKKRTSRKIARGYSVKCNDCGWEGLNTECDINDDERSCCPMCGRDDNLTLADAPRAGEEDQHIIDYEFGSGLASRRTAEEKMKCGQCGKEQKPTKKDKDGNPICSECGNDLWFKDKKKKRIDDGIFEHIDCSNPEAVGIDLEKLHEASRKTADGFGPSDWPEPTRRPNTKDIQADDGAHCEDCNWDGAVSDALWDGKEKVRCPICHKNCEVWNWWDGDIIKSASRKTAYTPKLPEGAEILKQTGDVVLAKWYKGGQNEFVTWLLQAPDLGGVTLGHYFIDLGAAMDDFNERVENTEHRFSSKTGAYRTWPDRNTVAEPRVMVEKIMPPNPLDPNAKLSMARGAVQYNGNMYSWTAKYSKEDMEDWRGSTALFERMMMDYMTEDDFMTVDSAIKEAVKKGEVTESRISDQLEESYSRGKRQMEQSLKGKDKTGEVVPTADADPFTHKYAGRKTADFESCEVGDRVKLGWFAFEEPPGGMDEDDLTELEGVQGTVSAVDRSRDAFEMVHVKWDNGRSDWVDADALKVVASRKSVVGKEMTLADHAEAWWEEQGNRVPKRDTAEWGAMYEQWVEYAFEDFRDVASRKIASGKQDFIDFVKSSFDGERETSLSISQEENRWSSTRGFCKSVKYTGRNPLDESHWQKLDENNLFALWEFCIEPNIDAFEKETGIQVTSEGRSGGWLCWAMPFDPFDSEGEMADDGWDELLSEAKAFVYWFENELTPECKRYIEEELEAPENN